MSRPTMAMPPAVYSCVKRVGVKEFARSVGISKKTLESAMWRGRILQSLYPRYELALRLCAERIPERDRFAEFREKHPRIARRLLVAVGEMLAVQPQKVSEIECHTPLLRAWREFMNARARMENIYENIGIKMTKILKFTTPSCPLCKQLGKMLGKLTDVLVEEHNALESPLAAQYNITTVPTLVILRDGKEIGRTVSMTDLTTIRGIINKKD